MWQHVKLSDVSLGICPRYSLVVDENVKKPTNQTNKPVKTTCSSNARTFLKKGENGHYVKFFSIGFDSVNSAH